MLPLNPGDDHPGLRRDLSGRQELCRVTMAKPCPPLATQMADKRKHVGGALAASVQRRQSRLKPLPQSGNQPNDARGAFAGNRTAAKKHSPELYPAGVALALVLSLEP